MTATATATMTGTDQDDLPEPAEIASILIDQIGRDERVNTRPVNANWVRAHMGEFSPALLGVPAVSHRSDGTYIVLDGQHRLALAKACEYGPHIRCSVYEGLARKQEARLFEKLNDDRNLRPGYIFLARVTQEDPVAVAILAPAERAGWKIGVDAGPGVITAVTTLEKIWTSGQKQWPDDPPFVLANTLQSITLAWQHTPKAQDRSLIGGVGALYLQHGLAADVQVMATQLAAFGEPLDLLRKARGRQDYEGGTLAKSVAHLVTDLYNKGAPRGRKLPPFR